MNKLIKDGKVAVLYSPKYGAGWSTWNLDIELLFDPAIVKMVEKKQFDELKTFLTLKYPDTYIGGLEDLEIEWLPVGTEFRIEEHDGAESIVLKESLEWITA
jgi:hypothetical protein